MGLPSCCCGKTSIKVPNRQRKTRTRVQVWLKTEASVRTFIMKTHTRTPVTPPKDNNPITLQPLYYFPPAAELEVLTQTLMAFSAPTYNY